MRTREKTHASMTVTAQRTANATGAKSSPLTTGKAMTTHVMAASAARHTAAINHMTALHG